MSLKDYELIFITREPPTLPGARYRAYNPAKILRERGYKATVISYALDLGAYSGMLEQYLSILDKIKYNIKAYLKLKLCSNPIFLIQRFNYHSFAPLLLSFKNRSNFIYDIDDWEFRDNLKYYKGIIPRSKAEFVFRKTAKKALLCLSGSHYLKEYLSTVAPKSFYLAPGIDTEHFKPAKEKRNLDITLAWVGTMFREEDYLNLKYLFEIAKDMPHLRFEIVGDGHYKDAIITESKNIGLENVVFKGWIDSSLISKYLDNISLGLFPLKAKNRFTEAKFPVKVLEFMSKGIPTVATSFGEVKHIIEDGKSGLLAKNSSDFKSKIELALKDHELYFKISNLARERAVYEYSDKVQAQRLISIIEGAL
jgi:glycosyltransferase involved in cell wall biosynthesis